jgi:hypothetical protein
MKVNLTPLPAKTLHLVRDKYGHYLPRAAADEKAAARVGGSGPLPLGALLTLASEHGVPIVFWPAKRQRKTRRARTRTS